MVGRRRILVIVVIFAVIAGLGVLFVVGDKYLYKIKPSNESIKLIENDNTKSQNILPEGWKAYRNEKFGFQVNYPEQYEKRIVDVKEIEFNNADELYKKGQENMSRDSMYLAGYSSAKKHMFDFYISVQPANLSLFAITVYENESGSSLYDFVSNEIMQMPEGIDDQRIINIDGKWGYRIEVARSNNSSPSVIMYYLLASDGKNVVSISSPIEIFRGGYGPNFEFGNFIKAYPKYEGKEQDMENILVIGGNQEMFDASYPEYADYIENLSAQSAKEELNKRLAFEKIVYSFNSR